VTVPAGYGIREARPDELDCLTEIEREASERFEPFGLAEVMRAVTTPREALERGVFERGLFVAVDAEGTPVGFSLVTTLDGEGHLVELDVLPAHGRRGLGRALVVATLAWCAARQLPRMTLSTLSFVPWNAPFYAALGFSVISEDELGPALRESAALDRARGLPDDGRVVMARALTRPGSSRSR
jgi:GNAT superfamily N-acetyltransferase